MSRISTSIPFSTVSIHYTLSQVLSSFSSAPKCYKITDIYKSKNLGLYTKVAQGMKKTQLCATSPDNVNTYLTISKTLFSLCIANIKQVCFIFFNYYYY